MNREVSNAASVARNFVVDELERRLVGPLAGDEMLPNRAYDTYHTGFLSPSGTLIENDEDEQDSADSEMGAGAGEAIMTLANLSQQSALGISFQIDLDTSTSVRLIARWAEYVPVEQPDANTPISVEPNDKAELERALPIVEKPVVAVPRRSKRRFEWKRVVVEKQADLPPPGQPFPRVDERGIEMMLIDRIQNDARIITLSLVNRRRPAAFPYDQRIYQVQLVAESTNGASVFVARPPASRVLDDEFWTYELLYRNRRELAVGHGCSVDWESTDGRRARRICSRWLPRIEVRKADTKVLEGSRFLDLAFLSDEGTRQTVCDDLEQLAVAYDSWIGEREADTDAAVGEFPDIHQHSVRSVCQETLEACRRTATRIRQGISCLRNDDAAWKSFCLSNRAIALGMRQSRPDDIPRWRAFQLAFILVCLPSTIDSRHEDRQILDLIWFPTGGGKTEAYLGLAAIAIFHRRLTARTETEAKGTTVLTRYTLRLLTIQQFERTARMICACELLRRNDTGRLGTTSFTCGLYIGSAATPATLDKAVELLKGTSADSDSATTLPLAACPWCDTVLQRDQQKVADGCLITPCPNAECQFRAGIPIAVVDEQIFSQPPTLVVGTIDKFARMAWEPKVRNLFGNGGGLPPSLIIQDELHLISDALGTLVALYETAIDYLCVRDNCVPKLIGSTATIRRAKGQCRKLYDRLAEQFPPNGLNVDNSFFYRDDDEHPGRLYVGVHAQGRSPKHTLSWTVGCLGQAAMPHNLPDIVIRDQFHTQVLYFNSLRELGGALVMAEDDVPRFLKSIVPDNSVPRRTLAHIKEMTGQVPSSQIKEMLRDLSKSLYDGDLNREALDLVFSTNMISVGIDVDRLGLMVVNGQPKTTSEYIQATSRVGRPAGTAGLVVTVYNWTRPRDRSHYERFAAYHRSFYRYVEGVSVTPFSARARDRALHAVLVALSRILIPALSANDLPANLAGSNDLQQKVRELAEVIIRRAAAVDETEADATRRHLNQLINEWIEEAEQHAASLSWNKNPMQYKKKAMLRNPDSGNPAHGLWKTLHSMRDVQAPSPVRILSKSQLDSVD